MTYINITNLSKYFKNKIIFNNINLKLNKGLYILYGENGSGKTTLLRVIKGYTSITKGNISIEGNIIYIPDKVNYPTFWTVNNLLNVLLNYFNVLKEEYESKKEFIINKLLLSEYLETKIKNLSKGTLQKMLLIPTLIQEYDIYLFDEPFQGLDEDVSNIYLELINHFIQNDKLIIISSHLLFKFNNLEYTKIEIDREKKTIVIYSKDII